MISTLNAVENVLLASVFSGVRLKSDEAIAMLGKVGLSGRKNAFSSQLSSGQQRRVAVARALVHGPKLLLCDEPTGDLDPETEEAVMKLIKDASSSGATVVMATHNHDLLKYCTKNIRLSGGRVA
jgi:putative ABC transport system ATP-binding protein